MHKVEENDEGIKIEAVETPDPAKWLVKWLKDHFQFFNSSIPRYCKIWDNWEIARFELTWTDKSNGLANIKAYFVNGVRIQGAFKFDDEYPHIEQKSPIEMVRNLMLKAEFEENKKFAADSANDFKVLLGLDECTVDEYEGTLLIAAVLNETSCERALQFSLVFQLGLHRMSHPCKPWEEAYANAEREKLEA